MASDLKLAQTVNLDKQDHYFSHLTPNADLFPAIGKDTLLTGSMEENQETKKRRLEQLVQPPVPGFVFDPTPIAEQFNAINQWFPTASAWQGNMSSFDEWVYWDQYMDNFTSQMYQLGLQDILDEAKRQIAAYQS